VVLPVAELTIYFICFPERALQQISMHFRADATWEVTEPVPNIGNLQK
jgi:hypothetical protein